jgi:hypothetical protein
MIYRTFQEWKQDGYIVKKGEKATKVSDDHKPEYLFSEEQVVAVNKPKDGMNTWEVIKFLTENPDTDKVFVSKQYDRTYDIYIDNYTKEFFIDEKLNGTDNWIYKTELKNYEFSKILWIKNWESK